MSGIKLDKDVTMPMRSGAVYPWHEMKVGDSFLVPGGKEKSAASRAFQFGKRTGHKFARRKTPEGVRIWRVE